MMRLRPPHQRNRTRVLPPGELHDQRHQEQPTREGLQAVVSSKSPQVFGFFLRAYGRARECSEAFRHRGIEVTTKHSYIIEYKYIWECTNCSIEFKRHSKSIDPAKHTCGSCKSKLVQTKPVPRTAAPSEYQRYFKAHFQETKSAHPERSHKDVMGLIAKAYKEQKVKTCSTDAGQAITELVDVQEEWEVVGDDNRRDIEMDAVSRTLDFLSLRSG